MKVKFLEAIASICTRTNGIFNLFMDTCDIQVGDILEQNIQISAFYSMKLT